MQAFGHRASAAKGIDRPSGSPLFGSDGECVDVQASTGGFAPTGLDSGVRHPISRGLERTGGEMGKRELDIFQAALGGRERNVDVQPASPLRRNGTPR